MKAKLEKKSVRLYMIMAAGCLLRLFYVIFSTIYDRQYDNGMMDLDTLGKISTGHLGYIQYIYENGLPDFDPTSVYQYHHPPLHHWISAAWLKIGSMFINNTDVLEESIQVVPFVCSLLTLWMLYKIVCQFELKEKAVLFVMGIFAFHPSLILLSGSINNDCMALLFTVLIVYWGIEWSRSCSWASIIWLALSMGPGMLVKQNVAEMAFPVAAVFLYVLVRHWKESGLRKKIIGQLAVFGGISVPVGMSFYVRNLIRFGTDIFWVYELPADSWQYTGNVPVINRFLWPVPSEMVDNLLNFRIGCGYNVWMQIIRTSVLGEWDMANVGKPVKLIAVLLMLLGAVLAFVAFCSFVKVFIVGGIRQIVRKATSGKGADVLPIDAPCYLMFAIGYVVNMFCYLVFAYNYPQQCSMHFRYIEITLLFPAVALGFVLQESKCKWFNRLGILVLVCFAVCSAIMTGVWCML